MTTLQDFVTLEKQAHVYTDTDGLIYESATRVLSHFKE